MPPKKWPAKSFRKSDKYIEVDFFEHIGRWIASVREPWVGGGQLFLGTHLTEKLAARCRDRALLKLEMDPSTTQPIILNFKREDYKEDEHLRNTLTTTEFINLLLLEHFGIQQTACLTKFLAEERGPPPANWAPGRFLARVGARVQAIFFPKVASNLPKSTDKNQTKLGHIEFSDSSSEEASDNEDETDESDETNEDESDEDDSSSAEEDSIDYDNFSIEIWSRGFIITMHACMFCFLVGTHILYFKKK